MSDKEKFLKLVDRHDPSTMADVKSRIENREMLRESRHIALKILAKLDELNWSQVDLANKMGVSKQQVNKILRGKENLTLETQVKIQSVLDIPILASYYEEQQKNQQWHMVFFNERIRPYVVPKRNPVENYISQDKKFDFHKADYSLTALFTAKDLA